MKKIILAISGIFCLQLAFIGHNLTDPAADQAFVSADYSAVDVLMATAADSPFTEEIQPADIDDADFEADTDESFESPAEQFIRTSETPDRELIHRRFRRPVRNTFVENAVAIKPIRIEYKTYEAIAFRPQPLSADRTEYPQVAGADYERKQFETSARITGRKKKNFFAKALPIIKKPYDWLKAVGSAFK